MVASLRLSGIKVALTDWHDAFSVLSPASCMQQNCIDYLGVEVEECSAVVTATGA